MNNIATWLRRLTGPNRRSLFAVCGAGTTFVLVLDGGWTSGIGKRVPIWLVFGHWHSFGFRFSRLGEREILVANDGSVSCCKIERVSNSRFKIMQGRRL